jgi:predicted RNase H-like nuclease (RuvC/YqgF family)
MDLHRLQQQLELNLSSIDAEGQTLEKAQNAVKSNIRENRRRLTSSYLSTGNISSNDSTEAIDQDRQRLVKALQAIQRKLEDLGDKYSTLLREHREAVLNYEMVIEQDRIMKEAKQRALAIVKLAAKLEEEEKEHRRKGGMNLNASEFMPATFVLYEHLKKTAKTILKQKQKMQTKIQDWMIVQYV